MTWIKHKINDLKYVINKWRIKRKHTKPIPQELWNLDFTFAEIISNYIAHFIKSKHGYPAKLSSNEEWDEILLKIQKGFENYATSDLNIDEGTKEYEEFQEAFKLLNKYFMCLWD